MVNVKNVKKIFILKIKNVLKEILLLKIVKNMNICHKNVKNVKKDFS